MKNITLSVPDEVYRRARIAAAERNLSLSALVREFLELLQPHNSHEAELTALFSALDQGHNTQPIGQLNRQKLYDRQDLY